MERHFEGQPTIEAILGPQELASMNRLQERLGHKSWAQTLREGLMLVEYLGSLPPGEEQHFLRVGDSLSVTGDEPMISGRPRRLRVILYGQVYKKILQLKEDRNLDQPKDLVSLALKYRRILLDAKEQGVPINLNYHGRTIELNELFGLHMVRDRFRRFFNKIWPF